jgi:hypothetical protein
MDLNKILTAYLEPHVGETCLVDGQLSMCIASCVSYGGGSGPLWAVENQPCQFTTVKGGGYLEGICKKVTPKTHSVTLHIVKGHTWGVLVEGTDVELHVSQIGRYDRIKNCGKELLDESDRVLKKLELEKRFVQISIQELRHDIPSAYVKGFNKLVGVQSYKIFEELIYSYEKVTKEVSKSENLTMFYKHQPIRNAGDQFRRKLEKFIQTHKKQLGSLV